MSASTHLISAANKVLRSRTDDQWLEMFAELPDSIRDGIAKIVWFDWLSHRTVADRNPLFDKYLTFSTREYDDKDLIEGLLSMGYAEFAATSRVRRAK
jgi:hypothetical protein